MRVKKTLSWLLLLLALLSVLLCLSGVFLLTTKAGTVHIVKLLNRTIPGLQLSGTSGRLYKHIQVESLGYHNPAVNVAVEGLELRWSAERLFNRQLVIESLTIRSVVVAPIGETEPSNEPLEISIPLLPISVNIKQLKIREAVLKNPKESIEIADVELAAAWAGEVITLDHLSLNYEQFAIVANASLGEEGPSSVNGEVRLSGNYQEKHATLQARLFGRLDGLQWTLKSQGLVVADAFGEIDLSDPTLPFEFSLTHQDIDIGSTLPVSELSGSLTSRGSKLGLSAKYQLTGVTAESDPVSLLFATPEIRLADTNGQIGMPISADVAWEIGHPLLTNSILKGSSKLRLSTDSLHITQSTETPYDSKLEASIENLSSDPHIEANLQLRDINFPNTQGNTIVLQKSTVDYLGTITTGRASTSIAFHEGNIGAGIVELSGDLQDKQFDIRSGQIKLLRGTAKLLGQVDWAETLKFNLDVDGEHFDPQPIIGGEQSDISFVAALAGSMEDAGPALSLNLKSLTGSWRAHKLSGEGHFDMAADTIQADNVSIVLGDNSLKANMTIGSRVSGEYEIIAPNLSDILAELSGSVSGTGKIEGTKNSPIMVGELQGKQLAYQGSSIGALKSNYRVSTTGRLPSELSLDLTGIQIGDKPSGDVSLSASGLATSHRAAITVDGPQISGGLTLTGGLTGEQWFGTMDSMQISTQALNSWSLAAPVGLTVSKQGDVQTNDAICLTGPEKSAQACLKVVRVAKNMGKGQRIALDGAIEKLPLGLINVWMPRGLTANGELRAKFNAQIDGDRIAADGDYQILDGTIKSEKLNGQAIPINRFAGTFATAGEQVNLEIGADIAQWFKLELSGRVPVTKNLPLSLDIGLVADDVSWLENFMPEIAGSTGNLTIDGIITGTRAKPRLNAKGKFGSGQLVVPSAGLSLSEINLNVDNDVDDHLLFKLSATSIENQITMSGDLNLAEKKLPYELTIQGSNFPLARLPELELDISPALKISGDTNQHTITGKLDVPYFAYTLTEIPKSATRVSTDQVIVTASGEEQLLPQEKMPDWFIDALAMKIDVSLGEKVTADGLGLFAHLNGSLKLLKEFGRDLNGQGTVIISEGHFDAYGQELSVSKGRVRFAGPLSNPSLKIRALRENIPVTAGIDISGTARDPKFEIFSEPTLAAGEALSYVVVGRSLGDGSQSDGALISQAALGLGLEQSAVITNKVRDLFALDELGVQTGNAIDETALVAGKQLTPKVSVRSEMNIFDQLWSFYLRYQLTDKWSIEAESGEQQGADVIYQVEHESIKEFLPFSD